MGFSVRYEWIEAEGPPLIHVNGTLGPIHTDDLIAELLEARDRFFPLVCETCEAEDDLNRFMAEADERSFLERAEELRQEDEMQAEALENGELVLPVNGAFPTALEVMNWIETNLRPDQHLAIDVVPGMPEDTLGYLYATD